MLKCVSQMLPSPRLPWMVFPVLVALLPAGAAAQGVVFVLNADGDSAFPAGTPISVSAEEFTDLNTRLQDVIEKALVARGYTVQPNAAFMLTYDTEMSAQTDPLPRESTDDGMEQVEQQMEQTPPWDDGGGEQGAGEPEMFNSDIASIPLGGSSKANQTEYSLSFILGQDGSPVIWQGSVTAVMPGGDPFETAEAMVPVLTDHIGQTVRGKQVPIE